VTGSVPSDSPTFVLGQGHLGQCDRQVFRYQTIKKSQM